MNRTFNVAGIGELLWDVFPEHKRLGGAPANFSCHCGQLGANAKPVSCVGADPLGKELRESLKELGMSAEFIFESAEYPTGTVEVVLNEMGKPTYQIHEDVAWDHIPCPDALKDFAASLDAVCFGSLSQRAGESRGSIRSFIREVPDNALKIYDVNLRQAFFSKQIVSESLELANVLKLSDEELPVLAGYFDLTGDTEEQLTALRRMFSLKLIFFTRGKDGSLLLSAHETDDCPGCEGLAVDSVGAGDSATAALCMGVLQGWPLSKVNLYTNEVSTFVCMQKGATPVLPERLVNYEPVTESEERA
ncbi:carbohydrate kinase family protein [Pontiella agarivorans]|uniref:Carbohydrate kinase n=1 Tax=Pontiella agarivorans TaxID=3038953 RepID=A0ABU5MVU8_9BACT|nr:carbohydrate kinase [Pontiella agarivorans]MDZ8118330.1 carbohydrate kinase [Pontiella agarivorans]